MLTTALRWFDSSTVVLRAVALQAHAVALQAHAVAVLAHAVALQAHAVALLAQAFQLQPLFGFPDLYRLALRFWMGDQPIARPSLEPNTVYSAGGVRTCDDSIQVVEDLGQCSHMP